MFLKLRDPHLSRVLGDKWFSLSPHPPQGTMGNEILQIHLAPGVLWETYFHYKIKSWWGWRWVRGERDIMEVPSDLWS